jgi:hypothetical protein
MDKLKTPKPGATTRLRELYKEIAERPFSSELVDILKKKPKYSEQPKKKIAKGKNDAELG